MLEAGLQTSDYTDKVDVSRSDYGGGFFGFFSSWSSENPSKKELIERCLNELFSILSGLVMCSNYYEGMELLQNENFSKNGAFFQNIFEVGRRFKIMNPDKMRNTYGKLVSFRNLEKVNYWL